MFRGISMLLGTHKIWNFHDEFQYLKFQGGTSGYICVALLPYIRDTISKT